MAVRESSTPNERKDKDMHHPCIVLLNGPDDDIASLLAPLEERWTDEDTCIGVWDWWVLGGRYLPYCPAGPVCRKSDLGGDVGPWFSVLAEGVYRERAPWVDDDNGGHFESSDRYDAWFARFWPMVPDSQWVAVIDMHS